MNAQGEYDPRIPYVGLPLQVPRAVATCPVCDEDIWIDVDGWEVPSGAPDSLLCFCGKGDCALDPASCDWDYQQLVEVSSACEEWAAKYVRVEQ